MHLSKKIIVQKTLQVASATLLSRVFGIIREFLMVSYLGAGATSDAFIAAFRVPNALRKIFAEGALSATFIPSLIKTTRTQGQTAADRLMTLGILIFEGTLLMVCIGAMLKAEAIIRFVAPGFLPEQIQDAVPFLRLLMPFIIFISSSALLAGALQSVGKFLVPAYAPVMLNIVLIGGLLLCIAGKLPIFYLCLTILVGGCITLLLHLIAYLRSNFALRGSINHATLTTFWSILVRFIPCSISMSITEISGFIDCRFGSYLAVGTLSLVNYANRFLGIPVGVFGVAFSTILLPHFARVSTYAPRRMSFYLLEASKLIFWVMLPAACMMAFFADKFFLTIFVPTGKFTLEQASEAGAILSAYLIGLSSIALNKIILNIYYSLHSVWIPFWISVMVTFINIGANIMLIGPFGAMGLALATSLSVIVQSILLMILLRYYFGLRLYIQVFMQFFMRYCMQLVCVLAPLFVIYQWLYRTIATYHGTIPLFFLERIGFWLWVGPLCCSGLLILFATRRLFGINLYFID